MLTAARFMILTVSALALLSGQSFAQRQLPSVVQLPSFSSFSYDGSVLVPDGGEAHLGSVKRSASGSSRRGLSRASGFDHGISQATAKVHIIDHAEIDRQLLGGTPEEFLRRQRANEARLGIDPLAPVDPDGKGKSLVRQARREYRAGNQSSSFASYRLAIGNLRSENLRRLATAEFKRLFGASADQALRMASLR
ncbi:hypothetical protein [Planctomycetes bacterium K23_9]|uniref:Uncharacterized protein n=1 Tax=Stieleria marina TaxID=1930275 RepID=A0A517P3F4_9BACT|nr:hypothetical protein K239x_59210 [Planctomycetes bacterium K23_9]